MLGFFLPNGISDFSKAALTRFTCNLSLPAEVCSGYAL